MEELIKILYANHDSERAAGMAAYMKNHFTFLGIPKPSRGQLQKEFIKQAKKQGELDWEQIFTLWDMPEREFQYVALDYLAALQGRLQAADIDHLHTLITTKSWWDTVDILAANAVGTLCLKHPDLVTDYILAWSESDNMWLARTAILYQLKYKTRTDLDILELVITRNNASKEFFIQKAIGWVLREYSKTNREWVQAFLEKHQLAPLSVREAQKHL